MKITLLLKGRAKLLVICSLLSLTGFSSFAAPAINSTPSRATIHPINIWMSYWLNNNPLYSNLDKDWELVGNVVRQRNHETQTYFIPGTDEPIAATMLEQWEEEGGADCIRYSITPSKESVTTDEEFELVVRATYVNGIPYNWQNKGCGDFSIKVFFPEGFIQTGGDYVDFEPFSLRPGGQQEVVRTIKGRYVSQPDSANCFLLTKGAKYYDPSYLLIKKQEVCVIAKSRKTSKSLNNVGELAQVLTFESFREQVQKKVEKQNSVSDTDVLDVTYEVKGYFDNGCNGDNVTLFVEVTNNSNDIIRNVTLLLDRADLCARGQDTVNSNVEFSPSGDIENFLPEKHLRNRESNELISKIEPNETATFTINVSQPYHEDYYFVPFPDSRPGGIGVVRYNGAPSLYGDHIDIFYEGGADCVVSVIQLNDRIIDDIELKINGEKGCNNTTTLEVLGCNDNIQWRKSPSTAVIGTEPTKNIYEGGTYSVSCTVECGGNTATKTKNITISGASIGNIGATSCGQVSGYILEPFSGKLHLTIDGELLLPALEIDPSKTGFSFNPGDYGAKYLEAGVHDVLVQYQIGDNNTRCNFPGTPATYTCGLIQPIINNASLCPTNEVTHTVTNPQSDYTYTWYGPNSNTVNIGTGISNTFKSSEKGGEGTYRVVASLTGDISSPKAAGTFTITHVSPINATVTASPPTGTGTITLTAGFNSSIDQGDLKFKWLRNGGEIANAEGRTFTINNPGNEQNEYTVVINGKPGIDYCESRASIDIPNNPSCNNIVSNVKILYNGQDVNSANPPIGQTVSLTTQLTSQLNNNTGVSYQWQKTVGTTTTTIGTGSSYTITNYQNANAGLYTVTVTDCRNQTVSDNISLGVVPCSAVAVVSFKTRGVEVTAYNSFVGENVYMTLELTDGTGVSYSWTKNGNTIGGATTKTFEIPAVNYGDAGTYEITATKTGCPPIKRKVNLSVRCQELVVDAFVNEQFVGGTSGNNLTVRAKVEDVVNYTATALAGFTYSWSTPGGTINNRVGVVNPVVASSAGTYTLTATNGQGCNLSASFTLDVSCFDPIEEAYVTADGIPILSDPATVSVGQNLVLIVSEEPGATYSWNGPVGKFPAAVTNGPFPAQGIGAATKAKEGRYTINVSKAGCTQSDEVNILVVCPQLENIQANNSSPFYQLRTGNLVHLWTNRQNEPGYTFTWYKNASKTFPHGGTFYSNLAVPAFVASSANDGVYAVKIEYPGCNVAVWAVTEVQTLDCDATFTLGTSCNTNGTNGTITVNKQSTNTNAITEYRIEKKETDAQGNVRYVQVPGYESPISSPTFSNLPSATYRVWVREITSVTVNEQGATDEVECVPAPQTIELKCDPCQYVELTYKNPSNVTTTTFDYDTNGVRPITLHLKNEGTNGTAYGSGGLTVTGPTAVSWNAPNGYTSTSNPYAVRLPGNYVGSYTVNFTKNGTPGSKTCSTSVKLDMPRCEQADAFIPSYRTYCANGDKYVHLTFSSDIGRREISLNNLNWTIGEAIYLPGNETTYRIYTRSADQPTCVSWVDVSDVPDCGCISPQTNPNDRETFAFNLPIINCSPTNQSVRLAASLHTPTTGHIFNQT